MLFIDIVIAVVLVFAVVKGLRNGLFVELASVISFFVGIYIAVKCSHLVAHMLSGVVSWDPKAIRLTAFVITLIAVVFGIHLLAKVFSGMANFVALGWLNRLGGAFFGTLKAVLLVGIVLGLFQKINSSNALLSEETQEKSIFYNPVLYTSEILLPVVTTLFEDAKKSVTNPS